MKIVFMGTSAFAMPILSRIIDSKHQVVAVYTKAPSKQSRGMNLSKTPIHALAEQNQIKVLTPKTLRTPSEVDILTNLKADVVVVAAYGLIIPESFLNICKFGFINVHPSDLPRWRGAAPIQRSMMVCDEETAICIMKMDAGVDTGPVFLKKQLKLDKTKTIHQLTEDYAQLGSEMLLQTLKDLEQGTAIATPQSEIGATYASKILSEEEQINWQEAAQTIHGRIMALTPAAFFVDNDLKIKAIESTVIDQTTTEVPGTVLNKELDIACGSGTTLRITKLQRPGGKVLQAKDFLCGYKMPVGKIIGV